MAAKRITSVGITAEEDQLLEAERARIKAETGIELTKAQVHRAALVRGLSQQSAKKAS